LGDGAGVELFNAELVKVLENILDPNTTAKTKRSVTLVFSIVPDEDRAFGQGKIDVRVTLAPRRGVGVPVYIGRRAGQPVATERDTRQLEFPQDKNVVTMGGNNG
jgi:hypothetical protein